MSEPARQFIPNDLPVRPQPGPLRDWLANMKAKNAADAAFLPEAEPPHAVQNTLPVPVASDELAVAPTDETAFFSWPSDVAATSGIVETPEVPATYEVAAVPAIVPAPAAIRLEPRVEITMDLSELMAENIMLKAKLRVENDRYDSLQAILKEEMGSLRRRFETDMRILDEVCAERDQLKSLTATVARKMSDMRTEMDAGAERLAEACSDRDLWMARAEALAQPLFQSKDRTAQKGHVRLPDQQAA